MGRTLTVPRYTKAPWVPTFEWFGDALKPLYNYNSNHRFWRAHCGYECTDGRPGICSGPELEGVFVLPTRVAKVGGTFPVRVQGSVFASPPGSEGSLLDPLPLAVIRKHQ